MDAVDERKTDRRSVEGTDAWWCREIDSPESVDVIAGPDGERLSILGKQDGIRSESGVVAIVAELTDREKRMVGHGRENMGATSNSGQRRKKSVVWKQGSVRSSHGVAIGKTNDVAGSDRAFVDTRSVWADEVLGTACIWYCVGRFREN